MCEKNDLILNVFVYIQFCIYTYIECAYVCIFIRRVSTIYHLTRSSLFLPHSFTFGLIAVRDVEVLCVLSAFFLSHAL